MSNSQAPNRVLTGAQLEEEDELVVLPQVDNSALIERYNLSLVGRMFHRDGRTMEAIISALTGEKIWNVAGRVRGIPLGNSRFQIDFDSERDLQKILKRRPCHFSKWSFALERWEPHVGDVFPNTMTFWVSTEGIPSQFWLEETFQGFGKALGVVRAVDAPMARFQVTIKADEPLRFRKKTQLPTGEVVWVSLRYEKLFRWCTICHRICHEEDLCPLNPKTQSKVSMVVSGLTRNLEKQPVSVSKNQDKPPSAPLLNGKGSSHPSWWRPDLARSPTEAEKSREEEYRRRKAEGKRVHGNSSFSVWERLEKRQSGQRDSSSKARLSDQRYHRGQAMDPPRHKDRKEDVHPRSKGTYHRFRKNQAPPTSHLDDFEQETGRKRRFEDSFDVKNRKSLSLKEKAFVPPMRNKKSLRESHKPPLPPQASDSQATMSDPLMASLRAKQALQSPDHTRERPFRLNLRKRSEIRSLGQQSKAGNQTLEASSDTGSSAKKSLKFDAMESIEVVAETQQTLRSDQQQRNSPVKKSWYEQMLEEEATDEFPETEIAPLAIQTAHTKDNFEYTLENSDEAVRIPENDEFEEEGDEAANQEELNELEKDWMRKKAEKGCVNLNWTEEDEAALRDDDISQFVNGDPMDEDDLLEDEIEDLQIEKQASAKKMILFGAGTSNGLGVGRPINKGNKGLATKRAPSPKAQSGQVKGHAAAFKRLQNRNRSSPKKTNSQPVSAKSRSRSSKSTATGPGNSVFPSSSKNKAYPPFDSTGGSKKPPGTTK